MRRDRICGSGKRKPWLACSAAALRSSSSLPSGEGGDRDDLARSGRIEIKRGKDFAQRLHRRSIELAAIMDVEGGGAAGREPLLDQA